MQEWALGTKREQTSSDDRKAWNKGWKNESLHLEEIYHSYPWDGWQWIFARPPHFAFPPTVLCMWKKNGHLKTLRGTALSTDPCSALRLHCTHPPMGSIWCPLLSEGCTWDKRGGRACLSLQPTSCCWRMLLHATWAATDRVRRRPVPQRPQQLSVCSPPWAVLLHKHTAAVSSNISGSSVTQLGSNWAQHYPTDSEKDGAWVMGGLQLNSLI